MGTGQVLTRLVSWIIFSALFFPLSDAFADTIYLKNGSSVEGVVECEDVKTVELNVGYGTTSFQRDEIERVVKSSEKEQQDFWQAWGQEKKEIEKRKPEDEKTWQRRQEELREILRRQSESGDARVRIEGESIRVNVLLDKKIRATLILDSGAAVCQLSKKIAEKLGMRIDSLPRVSTRLADGRISQAALATLKSLKVQDADATGPEAGRAAGIECRDVPVVVQLEETAPQEGFDGLLGMSFLKNFKFNVDHKNALLSLERFDD